MTAKYKPVRTGLTRFHGREARRYYGSPISCSGGQSKAEVLQVLAGTRAAQMDARARRNIRTGRYVYVRADGHVGIVHAGEIAVRSADDNLRLPMASTAPSSRS